MKRLRSIPILSSIAVPLTLLYVVLAVVASVCLFDHPVTQASRHHHPGQQSSKAVHSALCAWACQANPGASLVTVAPLVQPAILLLLLLLAFRSVLSDVRVDSPPSRGPPLLS
ncbi:MAG: hypothetical protein FJ249_00165 [Nitrospira sp.]|nr:hypothetical protein [Nitrospira sp.]